MILGTKIAFHLNIFYLIFYLKLPLKEFLKENINEKFQDLLLFLSHVLGPYQLKELVGSLHPDS